MEQSDDDQRKTRDTEAIRTSPGTSENVFVFFLNLYISVHFNQVFSLPAFAGSPHYSEDFEEENGKEPLEEVCSGIRRIMMTLVTVHL